METILSSTLILVVIVTLLSHGWTSPVGNISLNYTQSAISPRMSRTSRQQRYPFIIYGGCSPPASYPYPCQSDFTQNAGFIPAQPLSNRGFAHGQRYGGVRCTAILGGSGACLSDPRDCLDILPLPGFGCSIPEIFCCTRFPEI